MTEDSWDAVALGYINLALLYAECSLRNDAAVEVGRRKNGG